MRRKGEEGDMLHRGGGAIIPEGGGAGASVVLKLASTRYSFAQRCLCTNQ